MENLFEELLPYTEEIAQALGVSYNRAEKIQNIVLEACWKSEGNHVGRSSDGYGFIIEKDY